MRNNHSRLGIMTGEVRHLGQFAAHRGIGPARSEDLAQVRARVRKQRLVDEVDRGGGSLDVGEDGLQAAFASW